MVRQDRLPLQHESSLDLRHQRVLILRHSPAQAGLLAAYPALRSAVASLHEAIRLLNAGAAQGIVCDATQAALLASNLYPGRLNVRPPPALVSNQPLWLAPRSRRAIAAYNHAIDALPTGVAQSINERWLLNSTLSGMQPNGATSDRWFNPLTAVSAALSLF